MPDLRIELGAENRSLTRETAATVVGLAVYLVALHVVYVVVVAPQWGYMGLINAPADDGSLLLAYALAALPSLWLGVSARRISDVVLWFLYVLAYVPAIVIPFYVLGEGWRQAPFAVALAAGMLLTLAVRSLGPSVPSRPALIDTQARPLLTAGCIAAIAIAVFVVSQVGLPQSLPDLESVYETRATYAEFATPLVTYAIGWASNALLPILIAAGIRWRSPIAVGVGLTGIIGIYALTGFKEVLLSVVLTIALVFTLQRWPNRIGLLCTWGLVATICIAVAAGLVLDSNTPVSVLVRRLVIVPGQVAGYYLDHFQVNDPYLLSHSILRGITDAPYEVVPPRLIATLYFGDHGGNANGNLWADGFANFRYFGVLAVSILLGALLVGLDHLARHRDFAVAGAVLTTAVLSIANSALLTSLLTHGIVIAALLVALLPRLVPDPGLERGRAASHGYTEPLRSGDWSLDR